MIRPGTFPAMPVQFGRKRNAGLQRELQDPSAYKALRKAENYILKHVLMVKLPEYLSRYQADLERFYSKKWNESMDENLLRSVERTMGFNGTAPHLGEFRKSLYDSAHRHAENLQGFIDENPRVYEALLQVASQEAKRNINTPEMDFLRVPMEEGIMQEFGFSRVETQKLLQFLAETGKSGD